MNMQHISPSGGQAVAKLILSLLLLASTSFAQTAFQADTQRSEELKKMAGTWKFSEGGPQRLDVIEINPLGYANVIKEGKKLTTGLLKEQSPGVYLLDAKYTQSISHFWLKLTFSQDGTFSGDGGLVPHDKKVKALTYKLSGKRASDSVTSAQ